MLTQTGVTTADVLRVLTAKVTELGGEVVNTMDNGKDRLLTRGLFRQLAEVKRGDIVRSGVALAATDQGIWVHPHVLRLVCTNGATTAHFDVTRKLAPIASTEPKEVFDFVEEAVGSCAAPEVFNANVDRARELTSRPADAHAHSILALVHHLALPWRLDDGIRATFLQQRNASVDPVAEEEHARESRLAGGWIRRGRETVWSLVNFITAEARRTADPLLRWDLEELGGAILCGRSPRYPFGPMSDMQSLVMRVDDHRVASAIGPAMCLRARTGAAWPGFILRRGVVTTVCDQLTRC